MISFKLHPMPFTKAPPDLRMITAAQGYCDLGMWQDASDELDGLPPEERAAIEALKLRLAIFMGLKKWDSTAVLAESLV